MPGYPRPSLTTENVDTRGPSPGMTTNAVRSPHAAPRSALPRLEPPRQHPAEMGRRIGAYVPALDAETVVELFDRDRLGLVRVFLGATERVGMHEGEMGYSIGEGAGI